MAVPDIAIFNKDISLEHEKELRLASDFFRRLSWVVSIPINRRDSIEAVVISPYAGPWLKGVVEALVVKYGCPTIPVVPLLTERPQSL